MEIEKALLYKFKMDLSEQKRFKIYSNKSVLFSLG